MAFVDGSAGKFHPYAARQDSRATKTATGSKAPETGRYGWPDRQVAYWMFQLSDLPRLFQRPGVGYIYQLWPVRGGTSSVVRARIQK